MVGVGCDLVKISRFEKRAQKLALKLLAPSEHEQFSQYQGHRQVEFLAGRFAAKEAIIKALPVPCLLAQIEIQVNHQKLECNFEGYTCFVSIAHEKEYAMAYATCVCQ